MKKNPIESRMRSFFYSGRVSKSKNALGNAALSKYFRISIFLLVSSILINGCSKDPINPDDDGFQDGKYLISFDINGFTQDLLPFSDKIRASNLSASMGPNYPSRLSNMQAAEVQSTDIRDFINTLEIKIYSRNTLIDSIRQYAEDPNFGKFSKYYNPSNPHNLFITGAMLENNGDVKMGRNSPTETVENVFIKILPEATDAFFFYKTYFFAQEPQHENLKLKRFVGRVEVNIDEKIPVDADRIEITIQNTAEYFLPFQERGFYLSPLLTSDTLVHHTKKSFQLKPEDKGREDFSVAAYFVLKDKLGNTPQPTKITLAAYRANGTLIREREISNINLQSNKRTKLTGKLFSVPNVDFEMELESDWDSDVPEYEF